MSHSCAYGSSFSSATEAGCGIVDGIDQTQSKSSDETLGSGVREAGFAGDDAHRGVKGSSCMFKAVSAYDDALRAVAHGSGMCEAGYVGALRAGEDGSGTSRRPKKPGTMDGGE